MLRLSTIALLLTALLISACGGDDDSSTESTPVATTPSETTAVDGDENGRGGEEADGIQIGPNRDGSSGPTDADPGGEPLTETEVRKLVERFATSDDPADCDLATEALLRRSFGGLAGCRAIAQSGASAERVEIESISVDGQEADAVIVPRDGPLRGREIELRVIRKDGEAKVDEFRAPGVAPGP